jgi:hypothetical protein
MPLPLASRYLLTEGLRRRGAVAHLSGWRDGAKEKRSAKMIQVSVEIREGVFTRRVWITAPSIELALKIASEGKPGRGVRLLFPIDPEAFFVPEGSDKREAA